MTYFMAWVALVSAGIAACATVVELLVRPRTKRARWIWVGAIGAIMSATAAVAVVPAPVVVDAAATSRQALPVDGITASPITIEAPLPQRERGLLQTADDILPVAWLLSTFMLLGAILYGHRRLSRERASAKPAHLHGRQVLLTDDAGPAVAGVARPVVLVPRWVLALDTTSQQLLLDHEFEHVRQGDTRLLLTGAIATALMPWNPVVWWVAQRLRLAVEQDCDARVLRSHPNVRRYADLLLVAATQPRMSTRLLAAHFGEHRSDLDRRILAMTERKTRWHRTLPALAIAAVLVAVSCEAPRPEPLAPGQTETTSPQLVSSTDVLYEFQVEKNAKRVSGSPMPRYPEILRQAGVEGEVLATFVVNEAGNADTASLRIIRSSHDLFSAAVRTSLPTMRFAPAEVGGKKVKQVVQQPFTFELPGVKGAQGIGEVEQKKLAFSVDRNEIRAENTGPRILLRQGETQTPGDPVHFEILSSRGDVVSRYSSDRIPKEVRVDDIEAIEVFKPKSCPVESTCPLVRIRLKSGREAPYRP